MIYSNKKRTIDSVEFPFGNLNGFTMGENGRGRVSLFIPSDNDIEKGLNKNISIGITRTGKPRVDKTVNTKLFLILNTNYGYTRRGCGYVKAYPIEGNFDVIATANGADGDAGRIGTWDDIIGKVSENFSGIIRIKKSGGNPSSILHIDNTNVFEFECIDDYLQYENAYTQFFNDGKFI